MKRKTRLILVMLIMGFVTPGLATTFSAWSDQRITLFGDPDLSKLYIGGGGALMPSFGGGWTLFVSVNLTTPNPSSIKFYVNNPPYTPGVAPVQAFLYGKDTWIIDFPFQRGTPYTIFVGVTYPEKMGVYTCGTWSGRWDFLLGTELSQLQKVSDQTVDTLVIAPLPPGNINTVINGDTLAGGIRAHPNRVYELKRGLVYQVSEPMRINGSLTIIDSGATTTRPPVLAPQILSDNSSVDHFFELNGKGSTVTMKNLYLTNFRADGSIYGWDDCIRINADSIKLTLRGDIFDGFDHTVLMLAGQWDKMLVTDCTFRNEMHNSSYFGGGSLLSNSHTAMDTTIFVNNTFFCNNSYIWSVRGYCPNAVFSHNTLVLGTVNPFLTQVAQNIRMENNVFYAMHSYGGIPDHVINSWFLNYPDTASSSIIQARTYDTTSTWYYVWGDSGNAIPGPEVYVGDGGTGNVKVTAAMVNPSSRLFHLRHNDYFWPQSLYTFYTQYNDTVKTTDTVQVPNMTTSEVNKVLLRRLYLPRWISQYTLYAIGQMKKNGADVDTSGNLNVDPQFNTDITNQFNKLLSYVGKIASNKLDTAWYYNPTNGSLYPPAWPLVENLAYTNTSLQNAGTDGYALGDLNWFPTQKVAWLAAGGLALGVQKVPIQVPDKFELSNNYPNPFNPSTDVRVSLKTAGVISLNVYNVLGQLVKVIDQGYRPAGVYIYNINMDNFASGVYFYSLRQGSNSVTKKMLLLK